MAKSKTPETPAGWVVWMETEVDGHIDHCMNNTLHRTMDAAKVAAEKTIKGWVDELNQDNNAKEGDEDYMEAPKVRWRKWRTDKNTAEFRHDNEDTVYILTPIYWAE